MPCGLTKNILSERVRSVCLGSMKIGAEIGGRPSLYNKNLIGFQKSHEPMKSESVQQIILE